MGVQRRLRPIDAYRDMMSSVNMIVVVLVTARAALAFIVLYNLTNINITGAHARDRHPQGADARDAREMNA